MHPRLAHGIAVFGWLTPGTRSAAPVESPMEYKLVKPGRHAGAGEYPQAGCRKRFQATSTRRSAGAPNALKTFGFSSAQAPGEKKTPPETRPSHAQCFIFRIMVILLSR